MRDPLLEGERWLGEAEVGLEATELLLSPLPSLACFHAQQAAEKALKSILFAAGKRMVVGHSLGSLGREVLSHSPGYAALKGDVGKLDRFYIPTRYPNGLPEGSDPATAFDPDDALAAAATARAVIDYARRFLQERKSHE